jgi:hypothetical protein
MVKMKKGSLLTIVLVLILQFGFSQELTQTLRGQITDKQSGAGMPVVMAQL